MQGARPKAITGGMITLGLAAAGVAVIGLPMQLSPSPAADDQAMRAHALARLTDQDLRRIDAEARAAHARDMPPPRRAIGHGVCAFGIRTVREARRLNCLPRPEQGVGCGVPFRCERRPTSH